MYEQGPGFQQKLDMGSGCLRIHVCVCASLVSCGRLQTLAVLIQIHKMRVDGDALKACGTHLPRCPGEPPEDTLAAGALAPRKAEF